MTDHLTEARKALAELETEPPEQHGQLVQYAMGCALVAIAESLQARSDLLQGFPAPLTEREVTAEAERQGVEPASDEQVDDWQRTTESYPNVATWSSRPVAALIARVRAEQARTEAAEELARMQEGYKYKERRRADDAEARMALMAPVVEAVNGIIDSEGRYYLTAEPAKRLETAVRAYREATDGE